ncbi:MAG: hypothetical protein ACI4PV_03745, partial [Butyricicoccus sp.]
DGAEQGGCPQGYADLRRLIRLNISTSPVKNGGRFLCLFRLLTEKANSPAVFRQNSLFSRRFFRAQIDKICYNFKCLPV